MQNIKLVEEIKQTTKDLNDLLECASQVGIAVKIDVLEFQGIKYECKKLDVKLYEVL